MEHGQQDAGVREQPAQQPGSATRTLDQPSASQQPQGFKSPLLPSRPRKKSPLSTAISVVGLSCLVIQLIWILFIALPIYLTSDERKVDETAISCLNKVICAEADYYKKEGEYGSERDLIENGYLIEQYALSSTTEPLSVNIIVYNNPPDYSVVVIGEIHSFHARSDGIIRDK
jgi:hypothetical protein